MSENEMLNKKETLEEALGEEILAKISTNCKPFLHFGLLFYAL